MSVLSFVVVKVRTTSRSEEMKGMRGYGVGRYGHSVYP